MHKNPLPVIKASQFCFLSLEAYGQPSLHVHQELHGTWTPAENVDVIELDDPANSLKHKAA